MVDGVGAGYGLFKVLELAIELLHLRVISGSITATVEADVLTTVEFPVVLVSTELQEQLLASTVELAVLLTWATVEFPVMLAAMEMQEQLLAMTVESAVLLI
jgi:hypothetical protein